MFVRTAYKCRAYPDQVQASVLNRRTFGCVRTDFLHKASTGLVRGYDVIVLEDLAVKNILAAGLTVAGGNPGHACGADVRHPRSSRVQSAVKQETQGVSPGVPVLPGRRVVNAFRLPSRTCAPARCRASHSTAGGP
jgi:hypothetical protein